MSDAQQVHDALLDGTLSREDLTARRLAAFLGATTSRLYHHHGSLDGFLMAVSQCGFVGLAERLMTAESEGGLSAVASTYVAFGIDQPALYALMFEWPYDWEPLVASGRFSDSPGLGLWALVVERLRDGGHADPEGDARLLYAALHGLVHLARTGRANIGDLSITDRDRAIATAASLPQRLCSRSGS